MIFGTYLLRSPQSQMFCWGFPLALWWWPWIFPWNLAVTLGSQVKRSRNRVRHAQIVLVRTRTMNWDDIMVKGYQTNHISIKSSDFQARNYGFSFKKTVWPWSSWSRSICSRNQMAETFLSVVPVLSGHVVIIRMRNVFHCIFRAGFCPGYGRLHSRNGVSPEGRKIG